MRDKEQIIGRLERTSKPKLGCRENREITAGLKNLQPPRALRNR
jgi:hypothetical protein